MARSATSTILSLFFFALFATYVAAASSAGITNNTAIATPTANGTYTKPAATSTGSVAATSSIVGAAALPSAQYSALFALVLAIAGSFAVGLGL